MRNKDSVMMKKDAVKLQLIRDIISKQICYQEEALSKVLTNTIGSDPNLTKEKMAKDAMMLLSELPEADLNVSHSSVEEAQYFEHYHDSEFQDLMTLIKRLCKRERMLVTIYNKRINEIEGDKDSAEQALIEFMHKSSVPLINTSSLENSMVLKEM